MQPLAEHRRFERYDAIYFSPHLDDAVYSCGGQIAQQRKAGERVLVVTLFGDDTQAPRWGVAHRFGGFSARRAEDRAALARLDADYVWFNHPDCLFREASGGDILRAALPFLPLPRSELQEEITRDLSALCEARLAEGGRLSFPLAVGFHPDHRIVFEAGRALHARGQPGIEFYEDIPYALFPVMVALRLRALGVPMSTPFFRSVRELRDALVLLFGLPRSATLAGTLLYFPWFCALESLSRAHNGLGDEPAPAPLPARRIDDVIDDKVAAVCLYPSQTELLLAMDERLYALLGGDAGYLERSWRFPPPRDAPSARKAELEHAPG
jgi:LmbE family N-acetylglucosaminyl deacetylase